MLKTNKKIMVISLMMSLFCMLIGCGTKQKVKSVSTNKLEVVVNKEFSLTNTQKLFQFL